VTYRVVFTPSAKEDLREARDWYDKDGLGLGDVVLDEVLRATNRIGGNPEQFAKVYGDVRQLALKRFLYVISFRVTNEHVEILAILHGYRNPEIWKRRSR
jgi:toxin ParE1/3/4